MSQISEINRQILSAFNKDNEFYEALWGKIEFTPNTTINLPNDYNCGSFANALEYLYQYVRDLTNHDISELPSNSIDIIVYFFTKIKRNVEETDSSLISRMESLVVREHDFRSERMGTPWDIFNVLSYYVERDQLYYVPNKVITDLIVNGKFEDEIGSEWTILPSGDRSSIDVFSGSYSLDFSAFTSASQTVSVTAGSYIAHAFIKAQTDPTSETDLMNVLIQRSSDNYYYDTTNYEWVAADPENVFSTEKSGYQLYEEFIIVDGSYDITITFDKIEDVYLDHVELGLKQYPYFEIIYVDTSVAEGFAAGWEESETNLEFASFLDQDFMLESGTTSFSDVFIQSLTDTVRTSGIRGVYTREVKV